MSSQLMRRAAKSAERTSIDGCSSSTLSASSGLFLLHTARSTPRALRLSSACWRAMYGAPDDVGSRRTPSMPSSPTTPPHSVLSRSTARTFATLPVSGCRWRSHCVATSTIPAVANGRRTACHLASSQVASCPPRAANDSDRTTWQPGIVAQGGTQLGVDRGDRRALAVGGDLVGQTEHRGRRRRQVVHQQVGVGPLAERSGQPGEVLDDPPDHRTVVAHLPPVVAGPELGRHVAGVRGEDDHVGPPHRVQRARRIEDLLGVGVEPADLDGQVEPADACARPQHGHDRLDGVGAQHRHRRPAVRRRERPGARQHVAGLRRTHVVVPQAAGLERDRSRPACGDGVVDRRPHLAHCRRHGLTLVLRTRRPRGSRWWRVPPGIGVQLTAMLSQCQVKPCTGSSLPGV